MLLAIRRLLMSPVAACVCKWSLIFHTLLFSYKTFKFLFTSHKLQLFNTPKLFFHSCNLMLPKKSFLFSLYNLFDFITLLYVQKSVNLVSLAEISLFLSSRSHPQCSMGETDFSKKNWRKFPLFFLFLHTGNNEHDNRKGTYFNRDQQANDERWENLTAGILFYVTEHESSFTMTSSIFLSFSRFLRNNWAFGALKLLRTLQKFYFIFEILIYI